MDFGKLLVDMLNNGPQQEGESLSAIPWRHEDEYYHNESLAWNNPGEIIIKLQTPDGDYDYKLLIVDITRN